MQTSFFQRTSGRITLAVGGFDLLIMGALSVMGAEGGTRLAVAALIPLSIAVGIYAVAISTTETPTLLPVGLISVYLFLAGVFAFGLEQSATAASGVGFVLVIIGALSILLGLRPAPSASQEHAYP